MKLRLRPQAEADIQEIALHIAQSSPAAATRWLTEIQIELEHLAGMPGVGRRVEVRPALRLWRLGRYLILYQAIDGGAEVVRVIHGARKWEDLVL